MHPKLADPEAVARMRAAHQHARTVLGVRPDPDAQEKWGWHRRTLSQPVYAPDGPAWLRVACSPQGQIARTFWDGSSQAQKAIPATVPRPGLREIKDWSDNAWEYRAELYDRVAVQPISQSPALTGAPDLPSAWWAALNTALGDIATVPTDRYTIERQYLGWAMPKFLVSPMDTTVQTWTTAHGDLHWANLCAPQLQIFDWEGWGLAPAGYDAAMLHSYSLLVPDVAAQIRAELADVLDTPAGRFAELVTITEILHSNARGDNLHLTEPLRQRATCLQGAQPPAHPRARRDLSTRVGGLADQLTADGNLTAMRPRVPPAARAAHRADRCSGRNAVGTGAGRLMASPRAYQLMARSVGKSVSEGIGLLGREDELDVIARFGGCAGVADGEVEAGAPVDGCRQGQGARDNSWLAEDGGAGPVVADN